MELNDEKTRFKKLSISDIIQIAIAFFILITLILNLLSINEQKNYNENTLRPWIKPEPPFQILVEKNLITHPIFISNTGYSPAIDVYVYGTLSKSKEFPIDLIKSKIKGIEDFKKAIIFPSQKLDKVTNTTKLIIPIDFKFEGDTINKILDDIQKDLSYLHIYLTYKSPDNKFYYLKETFFMKEIKKTEEGIFVDWSYVWNSLEKL
ncbi:MAG: hypothetical protein HQ565_13620 [Bacteroidetes bacterium]|nr:hypothetical protein [Bacteroidota bacterium]